MTSNIDKYNLSDPETMENPFEFYKYIQREHPVYQMPDTGFYIISRYSDVLSALKNPDQLSSLEGFRVGAKADPPAVDKIYADGGFGKFLPTLVDNDPPTHTRFRKFVERTFTPAYVTSMEGYISTVANELIDGFIDQGYTEMNEAFAIPMTINVIADQLGFARGDMLKFKLWSDALVKPLGLMLSDEERLECASHSVDFQKYLAERIEERRDDPREDLVSRLVHARIEGEEPLSTLELLSICRLLLVAGNETTTSAIGSGIFLLATHPETVEMVRMNPSLDTRLAEEILRNESPVQGLFRVALEDVDVNGTIIPKDSVVNLRFGAANRDESRFPDAAKFDIARKNSGQNLAFGAGIHHCIGHLLARQEIRCAMNALIQRLDNLRLSGEGQKTISHHPSLILRAPASIPVVFEKRSMR